MPGKRRPDVAAREIALLTATLQAAGVTLLLVARSIFPRSVVAFEATHKLGILSTDEALEIFARAFGLASVAALDETSRAAAEAIVVALGYHPLAVKLAGEYARDAGRDLHELAFDVQRPRRAIALLPENDTPAALRRCFARSFEGIQSRLDVADPQAVQSAWHAQRYYAKQLFDALAAFATDEFGRKAVVAVAAALGDHAPEMSVTLLVRWSLLDTSTRTDLPAGRNGERLAASSPPGVRSRRAGDAG